ncbi:MAG: HAD hydrolase-like protein [Bdellovibrionota bacterium]
MNLQENVPFKEIILNKVSSYEHVIWDWNGTLLDDLDIAVDALGALLDEHNIPRVTNDQYKNVFRFPVMEYYKDVGFDLEKVSFDYLCDRFVQEYNHKRAHLAQLFEGTPDILTAIKNQKMQSILSAGQQGHLNDITKFLNIDHLFDNIFGLGDFYAASKIERGRQLLEVSGKDLSKTIMIGDTDHDHAVGKNLGIDILLIADGHQNYDKLKSIHHNVIESRRLPILSL